MFLSPLGERLGEGVNREDCLLHHPLTQPLPQGGEEHEIEMTVGQTPFFGVRSKTMGLGLLSHLATWTPSERVSIATWPPT
jgi:hypothetical protein